VLPTSPLPAPSPKVAPSSAAKAVSSANNLKANTAYRFYVRSVNAAKAANSEFVAAVATTQSV